MVSPSSPRSSGSSGSRQSCSPDPRHSEAAGHGSVSCLLGHPRLPAGGRPRPHHPRPAAGSTHHGVGAVQQAHDGQQEPSPPVRPERARRPRAALPEQAGRLGTLHRGWHGAARPGSALPRPAPPRLTALPGLPGARPRCGAAPGRAPALPAERGLRSRAPPRGKHSAPSGAAEGRGKGAPWPGDASPARVALKQQQRHRYHHRCPLTAPRSRGSPR